MHNMPQINIYNIQEHNSYILMIHFKTTHNILPQEFIKKQYMVYFFTHLVVDIVFFIKQPNNNATSMNITLFHYLVTQH